MAAVECTAPVVTARATSINCAGNCGCAGAESEHAVPSGAAPASGFVETSPQTEGALAMAPEPAAVAGSAGCGDAARGSFRRWRKPAIKSAAQLLARARGLVDGSALRIEVAGIGKKMLRLTVNAAAEKIIRQELQRLGAPSRFLVVPGEGGRELSAVAVSESRAAYRRRHSPIRWCSGPKKFFNAEVRSVVDLRQK